MQCDGWKNLTLTLTLSMISFLITKLLHIVHQFSFHSLQEDYTSLSTIINKEEVSVGSIFRNIFVRVLLTTQFLLSLFDCVFHMFTTEQQTFIQQE